MSVTTGVLTPTQIRERQIKDLKIRLENVKGQAETREIALRDENIALNRALLDKDKIIGTLQRGIASLEASNEELRQERDELRRNLERYQQETRRLTVILNKNSSNSSKPPSANGFKKIFNSREPSQRPSGGQKGHPGHCLRLPGNLDELVAKGVVEKKVIDHTGGRDEYVSRWTLDTRVKVILTEHRFAQGAAIPKSMRNMVTYGDNVKAMTVLLANEGIVAEERLSRFFSELTEGAIHLSDATIESFQAQFAKGLPDEMRAIEADLLAGKVMHTDDTPLRCAQTLVYGEPGESPVLKTAHKTTFSITLRNYSNKSSTLYTVNPRKDEEGIKRDNVLPRYGKILSHDHEKKFYNYGTGHGTCGEHLLRDLRGLLELHKRPWADRMMTFLLEMKQRKDADLAKNIIVCDEESLKKYGERFDALLADGGVELATLKEKELGRGALNAMLKRLRDYKDCYLLFMRDYEVPFTNNLSERDLRSSKTRQKVSGCFRSWGGAERYARIRGFISTSKKRGMNLLQSISAIFNNVPVFATH